MFWYDERASTTHHSEGRMFGGAVFNSLFKNSHSHACGGASDLIERSGQKDSEENRSSLLTRVRINRNRLIVLSPCWLFYLLAVPSPDDQTI
jgi:hypothetical protein